MIDYPRHEVVAFVGLPLMLMVPLWLQLAMVVAVLWCVTVLDMLGWRARRRART